MCHAVHYYLNYYFMVSMFDFHKPFLKRFYLFIFRERGREGERERNTDVQEIHGSVAYHIPSTGHLIHNPGMCPDWESNQQPFGSQVSPQSTEPHKPGLISIYCFINVMHSLLSQDVDEFVLSSGHT